MCKIPALCGVALLCLALNIAHAQSVDSVTGKVLNYPSRLFGRLQSKLSGLNSQLTSQTNKYLQKVMQQEQRIMQKLSLTDSTATKQLFSGSNQQYTALLQRLRTDTGSRRQALSGQYQPYADSLQGELRFLQQNPRLLSQAGSEASALQHEVQGPLSQLQALQAKLQIANQIKLLIQQREQQIAQYVAQRSNLQSLAAKPLAGIRQNAYYYSQQVNQYKAMLNDPGQLEKKALAVVSGLPAYRSFMQKNSQLSGLFGAVGGEGGDLEGMAAKAIPGLQTRGQIGQQVQSQISSGSQSGSSGTGPGGSGSGGGGMDALQSKVESAQSELDSYKSKLSQLGGGSGPLDAPTGFRPNDQKTKKLWQRLEYGINFQTTHNSYYYPLVTDFGASLGYRLGHSNVVGVGVSYKMGWGTGIQNIAITGQGVGLRSFLQVALKGSFSAMGGFEYNYTTPFTQYQQLKELQYWTKSGLIGVSKTVSMKSRVFKKCQLQLLWDFLSYEAVPQTQPLLFRIGYTF
jgi:hypothetical protein